MLEQIMADNESSVKPQLNNNTTDSDLVIQYENKNNIDNNIDEYDNELFRDSSSLVINTNDTLETEINTNSRNYNQSITKGKLMATSQNLNEILHRELDDVSKEIGNKIANAIDRMREETIDSDKYKEVIVIKKRILDDGNRKVINVNVSEKLIPKYNEAMEINNIVDPISRDLGTRAFFAGFLFLCAGLLFTSLIKIYQKWLKKRYIRITQEKNLNDKIGF